MMDILMVTEKTDVDEAGCFWLIQLYRPVNPVLGQLHSYSSAGIHLSGSGSETEFCQTSSCSPSSCSCFFSSSGFISGSTFWAQVFIRSVPLILLQLPPHHTCTLSCTRAHEPFSSLIPIWEAERGREAG
ncbi:hypothetical protein AMECASPLE_024212 [Ameca splendens]|uniref:Uncharacterized protein n=1 Tax=Ameca splendens TaxID=208324 RepID=A0ABV0Z2W8_9TELE